MVNKSRSIKLMARNKAVLKLMNQTQLRLKSRIEKDKDFYRKFLKDTILEVGNLE